jgi:hypothetical protein
VRSSVFSANLAALCGRAEEVGVANGRVAAQVAINEVAEVLLAKQRFVSNAALLAVKTKARFVSFRCHLIGPFFGEANIVDPARTSLLARGGIGSGKGTY